MGTECRERTLAERRAHLAAIEEIVRQWMAGEISLADKRDAIAHENSFFHGRAVRGRTGMSLTADPDEHVHVPEDEDRSNDWWNR